MALAEVPTCEECHEENPADFLESEVCPQCLRNDVRENPYLDKLIGFMNLQENGCPLGRHELRHYEWDHLAALKRERDEIISERAKERHGRG